MRMAGYKSTLQSYNERLDSIRAKLEAKTAVKEYDLTVDFRDYDGYEMPVTGFYSVDGGSEHYFSTSQLDLWNVANADSQVRIAVINAGSPDVSGYNCSVSWTTDVVYIDDIEYYACIITISNFNGDAFVTYRET